MDWAISVLVRLSCQKNTNTSNKKQVLLKADLGLKKIKCSAEDDKVAVYNQFTVTVESDETVGYL